MKQHRYKNSIKVPKVVNLTKKSRVYKTLGTYLSNSLLSPLSLMKKVNRNIKSDMVIFEEKKYKAKGQKKSLRKKGAKIRTS